MTVGELVPAASMVVATLGGAGAEASGKAGAAPFSGAGAAGWQAALVKSRRPSVRWNAGRARRAM
jgi:hypothetical protein